MPWPLPHGATNANGLINMRARYYNPLTMRFLNSDPAMDGLNWYAYANGNPINFADPTGYGAQKVLGAMNSGLNALGMVGSNISREVAKVATKSPASWNWQKIGTAFEGKIGFGAGLQAQGKISKLEVGLGVRYSMGSWGNLSGDLGNYVVGQADLLRVKAGNTQFGLGYRHTTKITTPMAVDQNTSFTETAELLLAFSRKVSDEGSIKGATNDWFKIGAEAKIVVIDIGGSINFGTIWQGISE